MQTPRNRYKTRRPSKPAKNPTSRVPRRATAPMNPSSCASTPPPDDHLIERLLRLWEHDELTLGDIADELGITLLALLDLIRTPEVDQLLAQMQTIAQRRAHHSALDKSLRALATLDQIQAEAQSDASTTPITPQAIKAMRDARSIRTQRRLAATATLNQLKVLHSAVNKPSPKRRDTEAVPIAA